MKLPVRVLGCAWIALALAVGAARAEPRGLERAPDSLRSWVEGLPESQRRGAVRRLHDMPQQRRKHLFQRWERLDEDERRALQQHMLERMEHGRSARERMRERFEHMPPESREKLVPLVHRWRGMEPAERHRMRRRLERFGELAPEDQQALIERKFEAKPPEERARILESLREASEALPEPTRRHRPAPD